MHLMPNPALPCLPSPAPQQALLADLEHKVEGEQEERARQECELEAATADKDQLAAQVR